MGSVIFDQLRVSDDGKMLYVNIHVNGAKYFEHVTLEKLYIKTSKSLKQDSLYAENSGVIYEIDLEGKTKDLVIPYNDQDINVENFNETSFSDVLLFVYVKTQGEPSECTPCALSCKTTLGVTFDENVLYQRVMQYTKELTDDCQVHKDFTDFILLWNAFKAAVETEHCLPAIKFYNMLFGKDMDGNPYGPYGKTSASRGKKCSCGA